MLGKVRKGFLYVKIPGFILNRNLKHTATLFFAPYEDLNEKSKGTIITIALIKDHECTRFINRWDVAPGYGLFTGNGMIRRATDADIQDFLEAPTKAASVSNTTWAENVSRLVELEAGEKERVKKVASAVKFGVVV